MTWTPQKSCLSTFWCHHSVMWLSPAFSFCRHYLHSMWSWVSVTVGRLSVRLSHLVTTRHCYRFAAVGPAARRYRSIDAQLVVSSCCGSKCWEYHIVSWCGKLTADSFHCCCGLRCKRTAIVSCCIGLTLWCLLIRCCRLLCRLVRWRAMLLLLVLTSSFSLSTLHSLTFTTSMHWLWFGS